MIARSNRTKNACQILLATFARITGESQIPCYTIGIE